LLLNATVLEFGGGVLSCSIFVLSFCLYDTSMCIIMVSMTLVMVFGRKSILLTPALFRQSTGTLWATQSQEIVRSTPVRHKQLTPLLQYVLSLTSTPRITDAFLPCLSPDSPPGPVHRLSYGRKTQNIQIPQSWKVGHHAMLLVIYNEFDEARASMIAHRELQHRAASLGESQMMKRCLFGCRWPSFRFIGPCRTSTRR